MIKEYKVQLQFTILINDSFENIKLIIEEMIETLENYPVTDIIHNIDEIENEDN